jgi:hypothetical protein
LQRNLAGRIVADTRDESNATAECRKIMRNDSGRTAQREHHSIRENLTLGRKFGRQTVENQVKI